MAHIAHKAGVFTGHIGPVRFVNGHAETEDPDVIAFCADRPDEYDVTEATAPDPYDDLTDEQVAEAYAVNVGGNASSRRGQLKALRGLDQE